MNNTADHRPEAAPPASTTRSERLSYWLYYLGQAMAYIILTGFSTSYLMMIGVNLSAVATAMFIAKLWDVFADALFGVLYDKVDWQSGNKSIPWLRLASFSVPITTVLLFLIPTGVSPMVKLVWFVIAYILWDTSYTMSDVPIYAMVTSMTNQVNERNQILSMARLFALGGAFMVSVLAPLLLSEQVGMSFSSIAMAMAGLILFTMFPVSVFGKERIKVRDTAHTHYTFKDIGRYLKRNKFLGLYYLGYLLWGISATDSVTGLFVAYYLFGTATFATVATLVIALPTVILSPFMGKILQRIDKFTLYFWSMVGLALMSYVLYLVGYHTTWVYLLVLIIRAIPLGIIGVLGLTFTPDIVEYGLYKTHIDARGIAFAFQSFTAKLSSMNAPLGLFLLSLFSWKTVEAANFAELAKKGIVQSAGALNGLWTTNSLVPAIGCTLAIIPLLFYKLNDHDVQLMARYNAGELDLETANRQMHHHY
ncbi:MFS transporter [Lacticaseibacillus daqingensis]|uniref:MFS transporter n=1 Tax=Lacticaseibacillus daqingensis TaxID=2486014 RepID=UPI000F782186|nr:MFS transporter [Lacticaseibacillus daqingensis]